VQNRRAGKKVTIDPLVPMGMSSTWSHDSRQSASRRTESVTSIWSEAPELPSECVAAEVPRTFVTKAGRSSSSSWGVGGFRGDAEAHPSSDDYVFLEGGEDFGHEAILRPQLSSEGANVRHVGFGGREEFVRSLSSMSDQIRELEIPSEDATILTPRNMPRVSSMAKTPGHFTDDEDGSTLQSEAIRSTVSRKISMWTDDVASGFTSAWNQVGSATKDALASFIDATDEAGVWAQEKIEEEYTKALKTAGLNRELIKVRMFDYTAGVRSNIIGGFKDMIKSACLSDPDMWPLITTAYRDTLDKVLHDIEHEIEVSLEAAILKQQSSLRLEGPRGEAAWERIYLRIRAFMLYHYLPHDLSIFGKIQDPAYIVLLFVTLLPVHFLRLTFLFMLLGFIVYPSPPDEFQLINFILMTKGSQFLSSGLFTMARGSMMYFRCFSCCKADMAQCIVVNGPGSVDSLLLASIDYLGAIVLPWLAFHWLPYSHKSIARTYVGRRLELDDVTEEDEGMRRTKSFASKVLVFQGGRLRKLLVWDVKCFSFSLVVLSVMATCTWREDEGNLDLFTWLWTSAQFKEDMFWAKVLYGLLSLPFLPFMIPLFLKVLTHCECTGFNEHGACVEFVMPPESRMKPRRPRSMTQMFGHILGALGRRRRGSTSAPAAGPSAATGGGSSGDGCAKAPTSDTVRGRGVGGGLADDEGLP